MSLNLDDYTDKLDVLYKSDPIPSFHFSLTVELVYDIPLKAVRNLGKQNEFEQIQEGGLNDYVHLRRKQISKPFTFEVERYITESWTDPLSLGTELTLPVILWLDKNKADKKSTSAKMFILTGVIVMGKKYGDLDSEKSGLATETITLGFNNMYVVPNFLDLAGINF